MDDSFEWQRGIKMSPHPFLHVALVLSDCKEMASYSDVDGTVSRGIFALWRIWGEPFAR